MMLAESMVEISQTGAIGIGIGGLSLLAGAAVTWGAMRNRIDVVERALVDMTRRLARIEAWQQREIGARSGNRTAPPEDTIA